MEEDVCVGVAQGLKTAGAAGSGVGCGADGVRARKRDRVASESVTNGFGATGGDGGVVSTRGPGELLVLTSACPGWVCYAEKTAPESLPCMSTVKSPQQVQFGIYVYFGEGKWLKIEFILCPYY